VLDYLLDLRVLKKFEAPLIHREISATCLTYLSFDVFRSGPCPTKRSFQQRSDKYVFQNYAASYVGRHLFLAVDDSNTLLKRLYEFITCKPLAESYLQTRSNLPYRNGHAYNFFNFAEEITELHIAALIGPPALVKLVVESSPQLIDERDEMSRTAIELAVMQGNTDITRVLLDSGASISRNNPTHETLLNCAARCRFDDIVELLIQHRSSSEDSITAKSLSTTQQLLTASMKDDEALTKQIIATGVDVDARDSDGGTALQWAAWYGYSTIVSTLLSHGADINAKDYTSGRTALHEASEHGNLSCVKTLLKHGAEVDARDRYYWTPLHRGAIQGGSHVVSELLHAGADINAKGRDEKTPLDLACLNDQEATIRLLLQNDGLAIGYKWLISLALPDLGFGENKKRRDLLRDNARARQKGIKGIEAETASAVL